MLRSIKQILNNAYSHQTHKPLNHTKNNNNNNLVHINFNSYQLLTLEIPNINLSKRKKGRKKKKYQTYNCIYLQINR